MTDFMFGDDPEMPPLEDGPDDYNEFNDETFGCETEDDWQNTHEKFSNQFGNVSFEFDEDYSKIPSKRQHDSGFYSGERARLHEEHLEESISKLVLDDEDDDVYASSTGKSQPISIGGQPSMGDPNMSQLFGPSSPPALFNPQEFISPETGRAIWASPAPLRTPSSAPRRTPLSAPRRMPSPAQRRTPSPTERHLKVMLDINPEQNHLLKDPAIVHAVPGMDTTGKIFTVAELEHDLTARAPPQRTVSPILGSPPMSKMMPVGTPPQHQHVLMQRTPAGILHQQQQHLKQQQQQQQQQVMQQQALQQQLQSGNRPMTPQQQQQLVTSHAVQQLVQQIHHSVGGRVSPNHITQMVMNMQAANGRASPNQIRQIIMANTPQGGTSPYPRPIGGGLKTPTKGMGPPPGMTPPPRLIPQGTPHHQQQRFGSPMMQQRPPVSPMMHPHRQGSPMMQQGGSPMMQHGRSPMMPFSPGGMMGGPSPRNPHGMRGPFGLTPMHPHIPPRQPFTDPGMRRRLPFNNQQRPYSQTPNRYGDNRYQRQYQYRRPGPGGDANMDDYANLMTPREKEWVQRIQMLQLQSNNPEVDDYYYLMYMQKKQGNEELSKEGVQAEKKNGKEPARLITPVAKNMDSRTYQPAQYEGALGRVTSSSVNNPRQLIDFHIEAPGEEEELVKPSAAKEQSKKRRTLLAIERIYNILLQLDDLEKQVLTLPESDRGTLIEKRQNLVSVVYANLKPEAVLCDRPSDDHFIQVLTIRKGRKLLPRVLPLLEKEQSQCVVQAILRNMNLLLKKEAHEMRKELQDMPKANAKETLPMVFPPLWHCIQTTTLPELTCMVKHLTAGACVVSPSRQYGTVSALHMQNKFGVSVILCLLSQAERIYSSTSLVDLEEDTQNDWVDCVTQFAKDICVVPDTAIPKPLITVANVLPHFARFVSKQTFNALEKRLRSITEDNPET